MADIYQFKVKTIDGKEKDLSEFRGKPLLIVNVASKCGFTYQYEGLEALYRKYKDRGFTVLGFPCNQFNKQEPGDEKEIQNFCKMTYDVSFPMFSKIDVNGPAEHPLYTYLKAEKPGLLGTRKIKWNFTKFLVTRDGRVLKRFPPTAKPESLEGEIEAQLT